VARGTVADVIAQSGLATFVIEGTNARELAPHLRGLDGVESVAFFGAALHVSGHDAHKLETALAPLHSRDGLSVQRARPSLEDVFIQLQQESRGEA
ncbi:MAG: ABC transporter ATP-binding protein, partial [Alphaproteobacteria bacterium]|nr:ABC transporter ATP-binding protein [Alphaproteobacteria bacterium]